MTKQVPVEHFLALDASGVCFSAFIQRIPGLNVAVEKAEALKHLDAAHNDIRKSAGIGDWPLVTVEQIHGREIAILDGPIDSSQNLNGYDGIITNQHKVVLGIHVADCCAVYIVDPDTPAIGLVHSGRKGTELGIAAHAIALMGKEFGSKPKDLIVQLSPCIRPPHYEVDFAAEIVRQVQASGITKIHDSGVCTACHPDKYYSYRAEKGKTGRMLAMLALR